MSDDRMSTMHADIGSALKAARERLGLSLEDLATRTKLSQSIVTSIESGQLDRLGPLVYVRGFIRSVAREVNMKDEWVSAQMTALVNQSEQPVLLPLHGERGQKTDVAERGMLAASYLVGTVILLSAAYFVTQFDRFFPKRESAVTATTAPINAPQIAPATTTNSISPRPEFASIEPTTLPAEALALPAPTITTLPEPQNAVAAGITGLPQLGITQPPVLPNAGQGLSIAVQGTVWVEITDSAGQRLEYNNLDTGTSKRYQGIPPYQVKIGNAGQVKLAMNGQDVEFSSHIRDSVARFRIVEQQGSWIASPQ